MTAPPWRLGTVAELIPETPQAISIVLELPDWPGHRAGQHVDVRVGTADGRQLERSYAIASAARDRHLMLTVERVHGGPVSTYLTAGVGVGEQLELRGPLGDFGWDEPGREPALLVADGWGIAACRPMLRQLQDRPGVRPVRVLYSARSMPDVIYHDELLRLAAYDEVDVRLALTHEWPRTWRGHRGRIDGRLLSQVCWPPDAEPRVFIAGPAGFTETVASALTGQGHQAARIHRLGGASGGHNGL